MVVFMAIFIQCFLKKEKISPDQLNMQGSLYARLLQLGEVLNSNLLKQKTGEF